MDVFRRYTNLAAAIHLLRTKSITLLNPATWDDKNDAYYMAEYKRLKKAKTVLALCFAECAETYHHWRVFSHGSDGVCIIFDKAKLLATFASDSGIKKGYVQYKTLTSIKSIRGLKVDTLPFLKRYAYHHEEEYRVVYLSRREAMEYKNYDIKISWIDQVMLSPWMSEALVGSVERSLKSIDGCSGLTIKRSTLISNDTWKELTTRVRV